MAKRVSVDGPDAEQRIARLLLDSARLDVPRGTAARHRAFVAGKAVLQLGTRKSSSMGNVFIGLAATLMIAVTLEIHDSGRRRIAKEPSDAMTSSPVPAKTLRPPCPELVVARGNDPLIEDWEKPDSQLLPLDGRSGSWVTYDDGTGLQRPTARSPLVPTAIPRYRTPSKHALHISGTRFSRWGVTFGAELANAACYDASAYAGIEFRARGPGRLKVGVQMIDVQSAKYGGFCKDGCYHSHRKEVELAREWTKHLVQWADLQQADEQLPDQPPEAYEHIPLDPARIRFLEFGVSAENTPFDLWLDDVEFVRR
jgi:hypothetical protein